MRLGGLGKEYEQPNSGPVKSPAEIRFLRTEETYAVLGIQTD